MSKKNGKNYRAPVGTYLSDPNFAADLLPPKQRLLLFSVLIWHSPGLTEQLEFFAGESRCGGFDVLWMTCDSVVDVMAAAWTPRGTFKGKELWQNLLIAYWNAEKSENESPAPSFNEIISDRRGAVSPKTVAGMVRKVWPDW